MRDPGSVVCAKLKTRMRSRRVEGGCRQMRGRNRARSLYALLRITFVHAYIRVNSTTCVCCPHPTSSFQSIRTEVGRAVLIGNAWRYTDTSSSRSPASRKRHQNLLLVAGCQLPRCRRRSRFCAVRRHAPSSPGRRLSHFLSVSPPPTTPPAFVAERRLPPSFLITCPRGA